MSKKIHTFFDGAVMDEKDLADLRAIELALQNPRSGSPAAQALEQLALEAGQRDEQRFPNSIQPRTGALCFCRAYCEGGACHCWCHAKESP
jgi:hypothetical protein